MTAHPNPWLPARPDDDLLLDRPAPQDWDADLPKSRYPGARYADASHRDRTDVRPVIVREAPPAPVPSAVDAISRGIGLLLKLTALFVLLALLWGIVATIDIGTRAPGAIGEQIGGAIERGANTVGAIGQQVADQFDPAHPPRQALDHDVEIDELLRVDVGAKVPGSSTRELTVASIERHADPFGPDGAVYAVLHGELREPRQTTVLGVTVTSTRDPRDYYLYKGESLRIGQRLYKVNWVSLEQQQVALIAYRDQDRVTAPLKAEIE